MKKFETFVLSFGSLMISLGAYQILLLSFESGSSALKVDERLLWLAEMLFFLLVIVAVLPIKKYAKRNK